MKHFKDWQESGIGLGEFLTIGDEVDDDILGYFTGVLPSHIKKDLIQLSKPYDHVNGKGVYATLERTDGKWIYTGLKTRRNEL